MKLVELRRNPELNPKQNGHKYAVNYIKSLSKLGYYGVSMTNLPKLGINPQSVFESPIGVYFYPAIDYMDMIKDRGGVPYQNTAPYIQIFKWSGNDLDLEADASVYNEYIQTWLDNSDNIAKVLGLTPYKVKKIINGLYTKYTTEMNGVKFWEFLYSLSNKFKSPNTRDMAPRNAVVRNYLLRLLDIDVVIDYGRSIIHPNEPCQGIVINPRAITQVKTIHNKVEERDDKWKMYANVEAWICDFEDITRAGRLCLGNYDGHLEFHPRYKDLCANVINKLIELSDSEKFYITDYKYIAGLLKLTKDKNLSNKLALKYFTKLVDDLTEGLNEFTPEFVANRQQNKTVNYTIEQCEYALGWLSITKDSVFLRDKLQNAMKSAGLGNFKEV